MNVSSVFYTTSLNSVLRANPTGQSASQQRQGVWGSAPFQQDRVSISPLGAASGILDALNKQRLAIEDRKSSFMASAQEDGLSMESIQAQLDSYDEQIKKIDEQIKETTVQQMAMATEQQKNAIKKIDNEPKTEQEIQNEKMNNLMELSSGLDAVSITSSVQKRVEGAGAVLESEIALDKGRGSTASKEAELAQLQQRSMNLSAQVNKQAADLSHQIQENNQPVASVEEPEESEKDTSAAKDGQETDGSRVDALQTRMEQYAQAERAMDPQAVAASQIDALV